MAPAKTSPGGRGQAPLHSSGDASRPDWVAPRWNATPLCSLVGTRRPCHAGASPLSVLRGVTTGCKAPCLTPGPTACLRDLCFGTRVVAFDGASSWPASGSRRRHAPRAGSDSRPRYDRPRSDTCREPANGREGCSDDPEPAASSGSTRGGGRPRHLRFRPGADVGARRRVACNRPGRGQHQVLAARPDRRGQLHGPGDRVALDLAVHRRGRGQRADPSQPVQVRAADGGRARLRQHRARAGGGPRRRYGRAGVDLRPADLRLSRPAAQHGLAPPRGLLLERFGERRRAHLHRQSRQAAGCAERAHRPAVSRLRDRRLRRPHRGLRARDRRLADDLVVAGRHRRRHGHRRQHRAGRADYAARGHLPATCAPTTHAPAR